MSNIGKVFSYDEKTEQQGIWLDYGEFSVRVLRASPRNKGFMALKERLYAPHQRALDLGVLPEKVTKQLTSELYAKTIVIDWEGVTDDDGNEIPFSPEACQQYLERYPDFLREVMTQSMRAELFRQMELEENSKNS